MNKNHASRDNANELQRDSKKNCWYNLCGYKYVKYDGTTNTEKPEIQESFMDCNDAVAF